MTEFSSEVKDKLTAFLSDYVTDHKQKLIEDVLSKRSRDTVLVLEDIYKPHNASAVIRTAECLGIQDIHVIQNTNAYTINPYVLRGSLKWLSMYSYGDGDGHYTAECFDTLKEKGYKILVTSVSPEATPIYDLDVAEKQAIVFGTEYTGVSEYAEKAADQLITIPMYGFTESFNVSVSAGIILQHLLNLQRKLPQWGLTDREKADLRFEWYQKIAPKAEQLIKKFISSEGLL